MNKRIWLAIAACLMVFAPSAALALTFTPPPQQMTYDDGSYEGGSTVRTDTAGNTYVAVVSTTGNGKIVKYTPDAQLQWVVEYDAGNVRPTDLTPYVPSSGLSAIAVDASDNIYAVGESFNGTGLDCMLKKYNSAGEEVWTRRYNRPPTDTVYFNQYCNDLTIAPDGSIAAAGTSIPVENSSLVNWTNRIIKWDADGNLLGTFGIENGPACGPAIPCMIQIKRIAADAQGNLLTIERHQGLMADRIAKYSPSLQFIAATRMLIAGGGTSSADGAGEATEPCNYLFGDLVFYDPATPPACITNAFSPTPAPDETTSETGTATGTATDYATLFGLDVDDSGNVIVSGFTGDFNKFMIFSPDLVKTCEDTRQYYDPLNPGRHDVYDIYRGVRVGPNGNYFVVGSESGAFLVMEYDGACQPIYTDNAGNAAPLLWQVEYRDFAQDIWFDVDNNLLVTGQSLRTQASYTYASDASTLKFPPAAPPAVAADLVVTAAPPEYSGASGDAITVTATIGNVGSGATGIAPGGGFRVGVYLSQDPTVTTSDLPICSAVLPPLASGEVQPFTCTGSLPANLAGGNYFIGIIADDGNAIPESAEDNNIAASLLTFTPLPDLAATSIDAPPTAVGGTPITVTGNLQNAGYGATLGEVSYAVTLGNGVPVCSGTTPPLAAGESRAVTCTGTTPLVLSGSYTLSLQANPNGTIREISSGNNTSQRSITITNLPDLTIETAVAPSVTKKGQKITVTGTIKNRGMEPAGFFLLRGYISADNAITAADSLFCTVGFSSVAPGATATFSCTGTVQSMIKGSAWLGLFVDSTSAVKESIESNNTWVQPVTLE